MTAWVSIPVPDDQSYQNALQRRQELLDELRLIEEFLRLHERIFKGKEQTALRPAEPDQTKRTRTRNVLPPQRLADMAHDILVKRGRPMTRTELVDAIEAQGIPLAGVNRVRNIGTIMWRFRDRFANIPGHGYWPRNVPNDTLPEGWDKTN